MPRANQATAESVFEHEFTARVNKEGDHHEVILTSADSKTPITLTLRNQSGAKSFVNGGTYRMNFTPVNEPSKEEQAAREAGVPFEADKTIPE
jgi:phage/plasmid primase-like uncharacterized protein